ncbi:MAG: TetR family transcriptional regulator, partial [Faecalibacillus sp.]
MTNEEISMNTKKKLSQSLKRHMQKKKLNKITVSDIVQDCQINRKTFYYHFKNIPDLVKWMLEEEAIEIVKKFDLMSDYEEAIIFVIEYVEQNAH